MRRARAGSTCRHSPTARSFRYWPTAPARAMEPPRSRRTGHTHTKGRCFQNMRPQVDSIADAGRCPDHRSLAAWVLEDGFEDLERLRSRGKYLRWMGKAGGSRRADCPLGYRRSSSATNARNWCYLGALRGLIHRAPGRARSRRETRAADHVVGAGRLLQGGCSSRVSWERAQATEDARASCL